MPSDTNTSGVTPEGIVGSTEDVNVDNSFDFSDLIDFAGVSDAEVANAVKEYEQREKEEEEAKKNKASLFPRIAAILGVEESVVVEHVSFIDISTSQILQASLFTDHQVSQYVGDKQILSDVGILAEEDGFIDDKLNIDTLYEGYGFISKLAVVWNFIHRKIEENITAAKFASKFKITDEDLDDAENLTDKQKNQIAVFAYRLRLQNSIADNHMWKGVFDKNLDRLIDVLASNPVSGDVLSFKHNSLVGKNLDEKLWWFQRASSVDELSIKADLRTKEIHRSVLKVMADMSIKDEDLQWILDNVNIENSADTIEPLMYEALNNKWLDGDKFSVLDYKGTIVNMIYTLCAITINLPAEGGVIPRSVRDALHKDAMRGLSTLTVAFGGYLPDPVTPLAKAMLSMAEKKMTANDWETFSEHFYNAYYDLLEEKPEWEEIVKERAELRQEWLDAGGNEKAYEDSVSIAKDAGFLSDEEEEIEDDEEDFDSDDLEDGDEEGTELEEEVEEAVPVVISPEMKEMVVISPEMKEMIEGYKWELDREAEERVLKNRQEVVDPEDAISDYLDQMFFDAEEEEQWID